MRKSFSTVELLVSGGFRYASMKQHFHSAVTSGAVPIGLLNWDRKFEGGGLTVGAEGRKSLASSRLSVFGSARGSLLYGDKTLTRGVFGDVTPPPRQLRLSSCWTTPTKFPASSSYPRASSGRIRPSILATCFSVADTKRNSGPQPARQR